MANQTESSHVEHARTKVIPQTSASVPVYGLGFIGAAVYYVQHAATFGAGVLGILKAMVWPAMLIYKVLELLKM